MSLALSGIEKGYGRSRVLRGIDLRVNPGEIVGLLGPNGSGKTTTLRIAAGFAAPDAGEVLVCGERFASAGGRLRRRIGYLPERPPLYDALTVQGYLRFVARAKGVARSKRDDAVDRVVALCDLDGVRTTRAGRLSKGFRQRLGLAQALLAEPSVLLLDEATGGLDPLQLRAARAAIRNGSASRATLFSTHILTEAAALCDRVVVIRGGRVVSEHRLDERPSGVFEVVVECADPAGAAARLTSVPGVADAMLLGTTVPGAGPVTVRCTAHPERDPRAGLAAAAAEVGTLLELRTVQPSIEESLLRSYEAEDPT